MGTIDFSGYVRPPRINAVTGFVLSIRVIRAAPNPLTAAEITALEQIRDAAKALQFAVGQRHGHTSANLRPLDRRFDGGWAGLHGRLVAATRLVDEPESQRAGDLLASLFPDGLRFLQSSYDAEWFHSRMLLDRIMNEDLYDDLVELAGQRYLDVVQDAHAALGKGLGLDENAEPEPDNEPAQVGEQVSNLAEAIGDYARLLAGAVNKKDPKSVARFLAAMAPIDKHRARYRSEPGGDLAPVVEVVAPLADDDDEDSLNLGSPLPPVPTP